MGRLDNQALLYKGLLAAEAPPAKWLAWFAALQQPEYIQPTVNQTPSTDVVAIFLKIVLWIFPILALLATFAFNSPILLVFALVCELVLFLVWLNRPAPRAPLPTLVDIIVIPPIVPNLIIPLIEILRQDMAADALLSLSWDQRAPTTSDKRRFIQHPWATELYIDPWLSLRGKLINTVDLALSITDQILQGHRSNGRRLKEKIVFQRRIEVQLRVRSKDFIAVSDNAQNKDIQIKEDAGHISVRVRQVMQKRYNRRAGSVRLNALGNELDSLTPMLDALAQAFRLLKPKKRKHLS